MPTSLTAIAVRNAKPEPGKRREISDGATGLYLVVQPSGAKSWALRYRFGGKPVKLTLGPCLVLEGGEAEPDTDPALGQPATLRGARSLTATLLRKVARGEDPAQELRSRKAAEPVVEDRSDVFEVAAMTFIERYAKSQNRVSSWTETARLLGFKPDPSDKTKLVRRAPKSGAFPGVCHHWAEKRVGDIRRRDVVSLLDSIVDDGARLSANRTFAALRKFFNWCIERDLVSSSPCAGVAPPVVEAPRDRVLSDAEVALVWKASSTLGAPFEQFIKMLILTGQRRSEVAGLLWSELTPDGKMWRLPRHRVKNDCAHDVPLSTQAQTVLGSIPRMAGKPDYAFTTGRGQRAAEPYGEASLAPISGFSKAKARLDRAIAALVRKDAEAQGLDVDDIPPFAEWRLHDLRRTCATGMGRLGVSLPVIEKVLNHLSGSFAGIVGVYQRHSFEDEKRIALQRWADHVEAVASGAAQDNIIPLRVAN